MGPKGRTDKRLLTIVSERREGCRTLLHLPDTFERVLMSAELKGGAVMWKQALTDVYL